jgi:hypothetical protein
MFPVEIGSMVNVWVKLAIKVAKQNALQHVDADALDLWRVTIPPSQALPHSVKQLRRDRTSSLLPTNELSEVFSESLDPKDIHLVVKLPTHGE